MNENFSNQENLSQIPIDGKVGIFSETIVLYWLLSKNEGIITSATKTEFVLLENKFPLDPLVRIF